MAERCSNCGAELFAGQQFCRRCGAAVGRAQEDAPTQLFPQGASSPGATNSGASNSGPTNSGPVNPGPVVGTSPLESGARTESVGSQQTNAYRQQTSYQPTANSGQMPPGFQRTSPLVGQPFGSRPLAVEPHARKSRRGAWLFALLLVFVVGVVALGCVGYVLWRAHHRIVVVKNMPAGAPKVPDIPIPPDLGDRITKAINDAGVPMPLDESGATVTGTDTVLTKSYEIDDGATVSIRGVGGNVRITGTDGDQAELKITKHGGSPQERAAARVLLSKTDKQLALVSAAPPGAVEISYEIKLPRELHQIEITSDKGGVKVEEFGGAVTVNVREGNLEFRDVTGGIHSKLVNGNTKVSLGTTDREGEQEFSVVNGDIEATVADGTDAELKAETITGDISVDERYGLKVERRPAGHSVAGALGDGGPPLQLKVVRGDIKLKK